MDGRDEGGRDMRGREEMFRRWVLFYHIILYIIW